MQLDLGPKHYAIGMTTSAESVQQLQGLHNKYVLVIIDEANGFPDELYAPIEGLLTAGDRSILFQIGNPLRAEGRFYKSFSDGITWSHTISCLNHPNVLENKIIIPGAVSKQWVDLQAKLWGTDSIFWQSRVLGNFPTISEDVVINLAWVEHAEQLKVPKSKKENKYMGVDPGEYGTDDYVWYIGTERRLLKVVTKRNIEPAECISLTKALIREFDIPHKNVTIDGIGAGATIYSVLRQDKYLVNRFVASNKAFNSKTYEDRTAEIWFNLRSLLNPNADDYTGYAFESKVDRVKADLCSRKFQMSRWGRYMLEPKPNFRKRLKRSCNWGDAMALCYSPLCKGAFSDLIILPNCI